MVEGWRIAGTDTTMQPLGSLENFLEAWSFKHSYDSEIHVPNCSPAVAAVKCCRNCTQLHYWHDTSATPHVWHVIVVCSAGGQHRSRKNWRSILCQGIELQIFRKTLCPSAHTIVTQITLRIYTCGVIVCVERWKFAVHLFALFFV